MVEMVSESRGAGVFVFNGFGPVGGGGVANAERIEMWFRVLKGSVSSTCGGEQGRVGTTDRAQSRGGEG